MPRPLATVALVALLACASGRVVRRAAHGAFPGATYEEAWERAERALTSRGHQLEMSDHERGILVSDERELQAPCGAESCLSRDRVFVRLTPAGQAVVNVQRQHWDPAARRWDLTEDAPSVAAVEQVQLEILKDVVPGELALRRSARDEPCRGDDECLRGLSCVSNRCAEH
ncbi:MAG: hypothetical protein ACJ79E_17030 [Anaeromyxobacteraceae bacterium]